MLTLSLVISVATVSHNIVSAALVKCPQGNFDDEIPGEPPCLTPECVSAAARIREFLDTSVDPCDNFYDFACGGWEKDQIIPPYKSSVESFMTTDKMVTTVRNLLSEEPKPSDLDSVKKAKDMYASCIAYAKGGHLGQGHGALKEFINDEFGGWPLLNPYWQESRFDFAEFLTKATHHAVSVIIGFGVKDLAFEEDGALRSMYVLEMKAPALGLPAEYMFLLGRDDVTLRAYQDRIYQVADTFGMFFELLAMDDIEDLLEMEIALANFTLMSNIFDNGIPIVNQTMSLSDLQSNYGELIDWAKFAMDMGLGDVSNNSVHGLLNSAPTYFELVMDYLNRTPKRTIANYIIWRVIDSLQNILVPEDEKVDVMFRQLLKGPDYSPPPEESCIEYISKAFELVLHRLLYAEKLPEDEIYKIQLIMSNIQDSFDDTLNEAEWVDEHTRKIITEKNSALKTMFVYFDHVMNDTYLDNYYAGLDIVKESFFENLIAERQEFVKRSLQLLNKPVRILDGSLPYEQVAFNSFYENTIKFSAGMFEPPFYSVDVQRSLNYGGMGYVFGHELIHSFDDTGFQFNQAGVRGDWWSDAAVEKFRESHQCLIEQYSNFYLEEAGMNVDGNLTLGENIADCGGLRQAFKAYNNWQCSRGRGEPRLPALNYTNNQLFFISAAQIWCKVMTEEHAKLIIRIDSHSPARFRVIGSTQNSEDFAEAFNCPVGSYMNPAQKCEVW